MTVTLLAHHRDAPLSYASTESMITRVPYTDSVLQAQDWRECNALGVLQARSSCWDEARVLFEQARALIRTDELDDARAVVSSNLASAHFFLGEFDAALTEATESLTLREQLWGDSLATARARSDVATIYCALDHHVDALALLRHAIATIETQCGEEAHELVPFIENAARAAIASRDFAAAEPLVLRLHGLLGAHDIPTFAAEELFAIVAESRGATAVDVVNTSTAVVVEASLAADVVAVEDIPDVVAVEDIADVVAVEDITDEAPAFDLAESFTDLELVEPAPPTLDYVPEHRRNVHRDDEALGFLVQHGTTVTPDAPVDVLGGPIGPLPELAPHPETLPQTPDADPATLQPPVAEQPTRVASAQTRGVQVRRPSRDVPVVMPSPSRAHVAIPEFAEADDNIAPRNALHLPGVERAASAVASAPRQVLLDRPRVRASGGARVWLVVGGGLAAVVAAVAWYMVQNAR